MVVLLEYIKGIILEGRVEDVKKKYPDYSDVVVSLSVYDPSGRNKYLDWMVGQLDKGEDLDDIKKNISNFHKNLQRLKASEKDINSYKTLKDLQLALSKLTVKSKTQQKEEVKTKEADIVFENEKVIVIEPKSHKASRLYGKGTKWCTSMKEPNYWDEYTFAKNVTFYYALSKILSRPNPLYKIAVAVYPDGEPDIFDAADNITSEASKQLESYNIPKKIFINKPKNGLYITDGGNKFWFKNNKFHRTDGPAREWSNGDKEWLINDKLHREDGPAVEEGGRKEWKLNGKLHRKDGPAVEGRRNSKSKALIYYSWYLNGIRHRDGGPADLSSDGIKTWYKKGKRHREDGPAVEYPNGGKTWYLNGIRYTEDEWKEALGIK